MAPGRRLLSRLGIRPRAQRPAAQPEPSLAHSPTQDHQPVSGSAVHNSAFDLALSSFLNSVGEEERNAFIRAHSNISADSLFARIAKIDVQDKETSTRSHLDTVSRFLRLLNQLVNGVSIGIQASPEISSLVVGGAKLIIDMAANFVDFFEKLTGMIQRLNDHLGHLDEFSKLNDNELILTSTANVYGGLLQFYHHAYRVYKTTAGRRRLHPHLRAGFQAQWKPFEEVFGKINFDIQHHLSVLAHAAGATTLNTVIDLSRHRAEEAVARQRMQVLEWLSAMEFDSTQASMLRKRWPGTGTWLVEHDHFKLWLFDLSPPPILWCHGGPGTGKSVMASVIVDYVQRELSSHTPCPILTYAYFSYQDAEGKQAEPAVASLTKQLIGAHEKIPDVIMEAFKDHSNQGKKPTFETMTTMFCQMAKQASKVFVVIDALDECHETDRDLFLGHFITEVLQNSSSIRLLITSRPETSISDYLRRLPIREFEIGGTHTRRDIKSYVRGRLESSSQPIPGSNGRAQRTLMVQSPHVRDEISEILESSSDGMFLWVELQLNQIFRQRNEDDIFEVLASLPRGLHDTYTRILQQIEQESQPLLTLAAKCLMWVIYGRKLLRLYELQDAISSDESFTNLAQLKRSRNRYTLRDIVDVCRGLIVPEAEYNGENLQGWAFVKLVHSSLADFLFTDTSIARTEFASLQDVETIECNLALACVNYLVRFYLEDGPAASFHELRMRLAGKNTPFAWYCARFFDEHAIMATETKELKMALGNLLEQTSSSLTALMQLRHMTLPNRRNDFMVFDEVNGRTIVETSRLVEMESIKEDRKWEDLDLQPSVLHEACSYGQQDQVKYLIDSGLDPTLPNVAGETPFAIAILKQRHDVVHLLLKAGVDVNQPIHAWETALEISAWEGDYALVTLLLDSGASGIENDCSLTSAVYRAVQSKETEVAKLLLSRGAIPLDYILLEAAEKGLAEIVEIILRSGVNPDGKEHIEESESDSGPDTERRLIPSRRKGDSIHGFSAGPDIRPLYCASKWGLTEAVSVLLQYQADANLIGGSYGTPLQAAALGGRLEIMKLLLSHGGIDSIDNASGEYGTALAAAAYNGQKSAIELLLDAGADVNVPGGYYGYPLAASVVFDDADGRSSSDWMMMSNDNQINRGTHNVTEVLIKAGADVTGQGPVALALAAELGHTKLAGLLVSYGVRCNTQILAKTAPSSPSELVELLVEQGADPNVLDEKGRTPLIRAVRKMNLDAVKTLLAKGADPNLPTGEDDIYSRPMTRALHEACMRADLPVVHELLDNHADPNLWGAIEQGSETGFGYRVAKAKGTALHAACGAYHKLRGSDDSPSTEPLSEVVSLLLEKGAKVNEEAEHGWTALELACSRNTGDEHAYKIATLLVDAGADINAPCGEHAGAIEAAARHQFVDIVELLLVSGTVDAASEQNALQVAAEKGNEAIVTTLVNHGVDVMVPRGKSKFVCKHDKPVHSAARIGSFDMFKTLLSAGANIHQLGYYGSLYETALVGYSLSDDGEGGWADVIKLLRQEGAEEPLATCHYGVVCNGPKCSGPRKNIWEIFLDSDPWCNRSPPSDWIRGTRYECCECEEFNLCSACNALFAEEEDSAVQDKIRPPASDSRQEEDDPSSDHETRHEAHHMMQALTVRDSLGIEENLGTKRKKGRDIEESPYDMLLQVLEADAMSVAF
ncbi:hypothetical protein PG991_007947 [Apiospora marii]|uniref:Nephrocystin 3-like N-terminal domain-containing protein n=1 Tax=Apiospora marii TaxID=335849 RepID=A0ABR1RVA2_9PEZI